MENSELTKPTSKLYGSGVLWHRVSAVLKILGAVGPQLVIHTWAHLHTPNATQSPSQMLLRAALESGAKVLLSSMHPCNSPHVAHL